MREEEKVEYLITRLQRIDNWTSSSDTKTSIVLATVGVLLSVTLNGRTFSILEEIFSYPIFFRAFNIVLIYIGILYLFFGLLHLLESLTPKIANPTNINSLHFFGDISRMSYKRFTTSVEKRSLDEEINDLLNQIHINSSICNVKHEKLREGIFKCSRGFLILYVVLIINYIWLL